MAHSGYTKGMRGLVLILLSVAMGPRNSYARMTQRGLLDIAREGESVVVGTIITSTKDSAQMKIEVVVRGPISTPQISVSNDLVGNHRPRLNLKAGDNAVLFLKSAGPNSRFVVVAKGRGKIPLGDDKTKTLAAVQEILRIALLKDEDSTNRAMLAAVISPNQLLRSEARRYISNDLAQSSLILNYQREFIRLLEHRDDFVRLAALEGLRMARAPDSIPVLIRMTRESNREIVESASKALAPYDTAQTLKPLIALTRHPDSMVRIRAAIDLGNNSRKPEAKTALIVLLNDKDDQVRATAPTQLIRWIKNGEADELIPKLMGMLDDPSEAVQSSVVTALAARQRASEVEPLLNILRRREITAQLEGYTIAGLHSLYLYGGPQAQRRIEANLGLVAASFKRGRAPAAASSVPLLKIVKDPGARAALRWAEKKHPNEYVRNAAKGALAASIN